MIVTSPKTLLSVASLVFFLACTPTAKDPARPTDSPLSAALLDEMRCARSPNPAPVLQNLLDTGQLIREGRVSIDSVSCFKTTGPTTLNGLPVVAVCGYEENPDLWVNYDGMFTRGPGTAPPQLISIQTTATQSEARDWYLQNIGEPNAFVRFAEPYFPLGGITEITCSTGP